jgi:uncharacterized protein with FMN-binding domain
MFPKKGAIALVTTALALLLLFSFKTPDSVTVASVGSTGGSAVAASPIAGAATGSGSGAATSPTAAPSATAGTTGTAAAQTVTGSLVSTRYGDVEVRVTLSNGKITAVDAITLPTGGRSGQISSSAASILASEALSAQSAKINVVSGATYTSQAYTQSLQAALDQAGIAVVPNAG